MPQASRRSESQTSVPSGRVLTSSVPVPAGIIRSDKEALEAAERLAEAFSKDASVRDHDRILPYREVVRYSQSGLWAITVPKEYGGAGLSYATLAKVIAIISAADGSLGQIPQNHFYLLEAIRWAASDAQKARIFTRVLQGARLGNALSEFNTTAEDRGASLERRGDGYVLNGEKFYSTGVIFSDIIVASGRDQDGAEHFALIERSAPGVTVVDDWAAIGQRTTASGTTVFKDVAVATEDVVTFAAPDGISLSTPVAHIIHAAIDIGIARGAFADTIAFVKNHARPWKASGVASAAQDPYVIADIGRLSAALNAAEALLEQAGRRLDEAALSRDRDDIARAAVTVYEAKLLGVDIALAATNKLFELGGTRSSFTKWNFDRHWRNARTHSLHDPIRWRAHEIGNYRLNDVRPLERQARPVVTEGVPPVPL